MKLLIQNKIGIMCFRNNSNLTCYNITDIVNNKMLFYYQLTIFRR